MTKRKKKNTDKFNEINERLDKIEGLLKKLEQQTSGLQPHPDTFPGGRFKPAYEPWYVPYFQLLDPLKVCPGGGDHDYESPWWSVEPPPCKKCGLLAENVKITYVNEPFTYTSSRILSQNWDYDIKTKTNTDWKI